MKTCIKLYSNRRYIHRKKIQIWCTTHNLWTQLSSPGTTFSEVFSSLRCYTCILAGLSKHLGNPVPSKIWSWYHQGHVTLALCLCLPSCKILVLLPKRTCITNLFWRPFILYRDATHTALKFFCLQLYHFILIIPKMSFPHLGWGKVPAESSFLTYLLSAEQTEIRMLCKRWGAKI